MRGEMFNYSTVNSHAHAEICDDEGKNGGFDVLETTYDINPRND